MVMSLLCEERTVSTMAAPICPRPHVLDGFSTKQNALCVAYKWR